jgi:hypothetical protein
MTSNQCKYGKEKLSRLLLIVALLLSIFTFPGYGKNNFNYNQKASIELACSKNSKTNRHTIAFKRTAGASHQNIFLNPAKYKTSFLIAYNNLIKVRLGCISKQYLSIPQYNLLHLKNIPQSPGDYIFISIG